MAKKGIVPGHTWQELKERFFKVIIPKLNLFKNVPESFLHKVSELSNNSVDPNSVAPKSTKSTTVTLLTPGGQSRAGEEPTKSSYCQICNKSFSGPRGLAIHNRVH